MNTKILHAPDIEDANFIEEDYFDKDERKAYEEDIREKIHQKAEHLKENAQAQSSEDLKDKVDSTINDAALIL